MRVRLLRALALPARTRSRLHKLNIRSSTAKRVGRISISPIAPAHHHQLLSRECARIKNVVVVPRLRASTACCASTIARVSG